MTESRPTPTSPEFPKLKGEGVTSIRYLFTPAREANPNFPEKWSHYEAKILPLSSNNPGPEGKYSIQISATKGKLHQSAQVHEYLYWIPSLFAQAPDNLASQSTNQILDTYANIGQDFPLARAMAIEGIWLGLAEAGRINDIDLLMSKITPDPLESWGNSLNNLGEVYDFVFGSNPDATWQVPAFPWMSAKENPRISPSKARFEDYWAAKKTVASMVNFIDIEAKNMGGDSWDTIARVCHKLFQVMEMAPTAIQVEIMKPILEKINQLQPAEISSGGTGIARSYLNDKEVTNYLLPRLSQPASIS